MIHYMVSQNIKESSLVSSQRLLIFFPFSVNIYTYRYFWFLNEFLVVQIFVVNGHFHKI